MIVFATKLSVKKTVIGLCALCAVVWGIAALAPKAVQSVTAQPNTTSKITDKVKSNEDRVAMLEGFGWQINETPVVEMEVQIPKEFDATYDSYNELQKSQGLNLEKYQGKRAMLYIYAVQNYPTGEQDVTASMVVYKNRLIAADISSSEAEGFTHGITEMPVRQSAAPEGEDAAPEQGAADTQTAAEGEDAESGEQPAEQSAAESENAEEAPAGDEE